MKSIGFAVFCLLCTVAWAEDEDLLHNEEAAPELIAFSVFTVQDDEFALGLSDKVNWFEAELICESQDFTLVNIPTETKHDLIMAWIAVNAEEHLQYMAMEPLWTSGTNQAVTSQYVWQSSGRPLSYRNFWGTPPTNSRRCLGLNAATGDWSHHDCREKRYFICEKVTKEATC